MPTVLRLGTGIAKHFLEHGMTTSTSNPTAQAISVKITDDSLTVDLADGRTISAHVGWYPRLAHASPAERNNFRFLGGGRGIPWPDLDEDISVENLLQGKHSGESGVSLARWLANRAPAK